MWFADKVKAEMVLMSEWWTSAEVGTKDEE